MGSQKVENQLNLALNASPREREKSGELNVGYEIEENEWELIIKYSGELSPVKNLAERVQELLNEYAIVTIKESRIETLNQLPQIEYIEKPKKLFFQLKNGKRVSCIPQVQNTEINLTGKGTVIGIVDSGIDYTLPQFQNEDGTTRIRFLWDQSLEPQREEKTPDIYQQGVEYTSSEINKGLEITDENERRNIIRSQDTSGHGTAVTGIAAGSKRQTGVAPESELIIVKMGNARQGRFPRTTQLMLGIDYIIRKAQEMEKPVAINISIGNTYGDHQGTSLLERYIDDVSNIWKTCICVGMGNEGTSAGHTSGIVTADEELNIEVAVQERQAAFSVQLWKSYVDVMEILLVSPAGRRIGPVQEILGSQRFRVENTEVLLYYGEPSPYSVTQEIYFDFLPVNDYVDSGVWQVVLVPRKIVDGRFEMWLPAETAVNRGTAFLVPKEYGSVTIPATAEKVISVGAYDSLTFAYADFSGRGFEQKAGVYQKPDLVAPGVDIVTMAVGGGNTTVSGTSFATPFVTGSAALLMEWGIVRGNDPYLYGEKIKAYLRRGARPLPGFTQYPNALVGYGALCVRDSLPI